MKRYFIYLSYNGTQYCGWQNQPNGVSVQQRLEETLTTLMRQPTAVVGAGRTDSGVHAREMVAHVDLPASFEDCAFLVEKMNRLLPRSIAIRRIVPVRSDAHARFDALSRTYHYYVTEQKDPFNHEWIYRLPLGRVDFPLMNEAAQLLLDVRDFTSFSKLHTDVKTNICRVTHAEWQQEGSVWVFTIVADRFLRNMVRAIVGTLLEVGRGKRSLEEFCRVIEAKDRGQAGSSAPGHGLSLAHVVYPESLFLE